MTILRAGTFSVNACRKPIPNNVKLAVLIRQHCRSTDGKRFLCMDALEGRIQFDHDPALVTRDYDTEARDFIPPQHSIAHIYAKRDGQHLEKTTGRKEGAEKTVTTRGSDVGEASREPAIRDSQRLHLAKMAEKAGDVARAAELRAGLEDPKRLKPKPRIRSRGLTPNGQRRGA